ncbi:MAG TPA: recombinase family protein [Nitrospiraceae bacterium]|nr:recombinase family protein [Nitrospiraceae bacterium]
MLAAIYARKSTEQSGVNDEEKSVTRQIEHAKAYAVRKGWTVAEEHIYVDDGVSGAEFVRRQGFLRLMNALKPRPPFQFLIMSEESRLGREAIQVSYAFKQIIDSGVRLFFYMTDQERKLDNAMDKVMLSLSNFAAEMEREKASQRTYDAMFRKAKALHVTGNKVFGYDNVPVYSSEADTDGTQRRQHVVRKINPEQSKVVVRIFELYASGFGLARIAKVLNEDRIPPPHGGNLGWCPTALRDILQRDLYRGIVLWNRTQAIQRGGTRAQRKRPESEWLRLDAPELRIIPQILWEQIEERRARNKRAYLRGEGGRLISRPTGEDRRSSYLLSSIAKCVTCGGSIVAIKRTAKRRYTRTVYRCAFHHKRGSTVCSNNVEVRQDILDSAILHAMNDALDERVLEASVVAALERIKNNQEKFPDRRVAIERELSLIEARSRRLLDLMGDGKGNALMMKELDGLAERKEVLAQELKRVDDLALVADLDAKRLAKDLRSRLGDIPALFARHVPLARQMLRKLLDGDILCEPIMEGERTGYRFTATGTFDRLLTGFKVVNESGGGQGS